jgi:hypothetical protein
MAPRAIEGWGIKNSATRCSTKWAQNAYVILMSFRGHCNAVNAMHGQEAQLIHAP